jgi:hypothetical protein
VLGLLMIKRMRNPIVRANMILNIESSIGLSMFHLL